VAAAAATAADGSHYVSSGALPFLAAARVPALR
jgi:hypothetical protein